MGAVAISPDGKKVATSAADGLRLWDIALGKEVEHFTRSPEQRVSKIAFSPDGTLIAGGGPGHGILWLWDAGTGKVRDWLLPPWGTTACFCFSPDGKYLAASGGTSLIYFWDLKTRKLTHKLPPGEGDVCSLAFSPDGSMLACAGDDKVLSLWHLATRRLIRRIAGVDASAITISPDGTTVAAAGRSSIQCWEIGTGRKVLAVSLEDRSITRLAFAAGNLLAVAGSTDSSDHHSKPQDGFAAVLDCSTGQIVRRLGGRQGEVRDMALTRDGETVATVGLDNCVRLFAVRDGRELFARPGHRGDVNAIALSRSRRLVATAGDDRPIRIWDAATGKQLRRLDGHDAKVLDLTFSPDDSRLVSGDAEGVIKTWEVATGKVLSTSHGPPPTADSSSPDLRSLIFSPDGTRAAGGWNEPLLVWKVATGASLWQLPQETGAVSYASFSGDGRLLASGSDSSSIHVWDLHSDSKRPYRLLGQEIDWWRGVRRAVFFPDGRAMASFEGVGSGYLWEVATGAARCALQPFPDQARSLAVSPDGRWVAAGDAEGGVGLWDAHNGHAAFRSPAHRGPVVSLHFSADSRLLASGSGDTTVLLWDVTRLVSPRRVQLPQRAVPAFEAAWANLAGPDAARAFQAMYIFRCAEGPAVAFLEKRMALANLGPDRKRLAERIADLDSDSFFVREEAMEELAEMAAASACVEAALRRELADCTLEAGRRIERLLRRFKIDALPGRLLRQVRAIELLEQTGTPGAEKVLRSLAAADPDSRLTREARASLERLTAKAAK